MAGVWAEGVTHDEVMEGCPHTCASQGSPGTSETCLPAPSVSPWPPSSAASWLPPEAHLHPAFCRVREKLGGSHGRLNFTAQSEDRPSPMGFRYLPLLARCPAPSLLFTPPPSCAPHLLSSREVSFPSTGDFRDGHLFLEQAPGVSVCPKQVRQQAPYINRGSREPLL